MDEFQLHTFPNGLRLCYQQRVSRITHCGYVIDVGSRDESKEEMGIAHFIEHLFFKGTERRKSIHILNRLEDVGGDLNAYTSKDKTCVYASVNSDYFSRAADLLTDIVFHSNFPEKEIDKERNVIHEEIDMYLDAPEENIMDLFQEMAFHEHPLGFNILGNHESLNALNRERILAFFRKWYVPEKMVFVYNGPKSFRQVIRLLESRMEAVPAHSEKGVRNWFNAEVYRHFRSELPVPHVQTYMVLGGLAPNLGDPQRTAMAMLTNILGGPGLNSKLNLAIRERHGFAYDVEAAYQSMRDIGLFTIYVGTDGKYLDRSAELVYKELKNLRSTPLSTASLHRYKNQLKGQLLMGEENRIGIALSSGKLLLDERPLESLDELFKRIDAVSAGDIRNVAAAWLNESQLSTLIFKGRPERDQLN